MIETQQNASAHRIPSSHGYRASSASHAEGAVTAAAIAKIEDLTQQVVEMKLTIDGLERERDVYFAKLRDIEVYSSLICLYFTCLPMQVIIQETNTSEIGQAVLDVLYAAEVTN